MYKKYKICSRHFEDHDYSSENRRKLKSTACPSKFGTFEKNISITQLKENLKNKLVNNCETSMMIHSKCLKDAPAALKDINDPDWAPSLFLGHNYFQPDKHGKGKSGNEIEDLLYDPSKGRKWHPLLEQKKYYEEAHSDEIVDIIEWRSSLEKKRLKALNTDSEDTNESTKDGKPSDINSPVTIIYLRGERS